MNRLTSKQQHIMADAIKRAHILTLPPFSNNIYCAYVCMHVHMKLKVHACTTYTNALINNVFIILLITLQLSYHVVINSQRASLIYLNIPLHYRHLHMYIHGVCICMC